jgi:hypothetical protein
LQQPPCCWQLSPSAAQGEQTAPAQVPLQHSAKPWQDSPPALQLAVLLVDVEPELVVAWPPDPPPDVVDWVAPPLPEVELEPPAPPLWLTPPLPPAPPPAPVVVDEAVVVVGFQSSPPLPPKPLPKPLSSVLPHATAAPTSAIEPKTK